MQGKLHYKTIHGRALIGNPLGDPIDRTCVIYTPPQFQDSPQTKLPLLVDLPPYSSSGIARAGWKNFYRSVPEIIDDLIISGVLDPCVVAFPDTFTKLGGNQHINSPAIGNYADYIMEDVVPYVETEFAPSATIGGPGHRGVYGYSSGGYAALIYGMIYHDFWSGIACHSGDIGFELGYLYDLPSVMLHFKSYHYDSKKFIDAFWAKKQKRASGADVHLLMMIAMAATYDPESCDAENLYFPLPVANPYTFEIDQNKWQRWLRHDPLTIAKTHHEKLQSLKSIYLDCGMNDEYRLQYGARKLSKILTDNSVQHDYFDFEGSHMGIEYRLDNSLPNLVKSLYATSSTVS